MGACFVFVIWVKFHVKHFIIELMVKKVSKVLTMLESSVNSLKKIRIIDKKVQLLYVDYLDIEILYVMMKMFHVKHEYYQINQ